MLNSHLVSNDISNIIDYYKKEEKLIHTSVNLYSAVSIQEFTPIIKEIQKRHPNLDIVYTRIETDKNSLCLRTNGELSILIPSQLIMAKEGTFEYHFQSHLKNIFGTLTVDLETDSSGSVISKNHQIFATSIGY